ncbi:MAG: YicC family protein [Candidatus Omnitrophica bacterium]|nr:YicC family protein [Candidatus Omnitrophota bacterium]
MTGFGAGELRTKKGSFIVEIRTLNHKFLEVTPKLPNSLGIFDEKVKMLIKNEIKRGKVYFNLIYDTTQESGASILIDEKLAKSYLGKLKAMKKHLKLEGSIELSNIIAFPGVINYRQEEKDVAKLWPYIEEATKKAIKKLIKDREKEGNFLFNDLSKRIKKIRNVVLDIKKDASSNVRNYKKRLQARIKELTGGYAIDKGRLEVEVALFAKNSDITEELTRLSNHINNFVRTIKRKGEAGKKLDFIAQELHREINTIGSKSSGFNISKGAIEAKTEIEKIREQLKNIE